MDLLVEIVPEVDVRTRIAVGKGLVLRDAQTVDALVENPRGAPLDVFRQLTEDVKLGIDLVEIEFQEDQVDLVPDRPQLPVVDLSLDAPKLKSCLPRGGCHGRAEPD